MEISTLENKDLDLIEIIIKTSLSIDKLYSKLFELESKGKGKSKEYNIYLDYLTVAIEAENSQYEEIKSKPKKCSRYIDHLFCIEVNNNEFSDINSLVKQEYSDRHIRRIINELLKYSLQDQDLFNAFRRDLISGYISIIQELVNSNLLHSYNNQLISSKYNASYIDKNLEILMISSNFMPANNFPTSSILNASLTDIDNYKYNKYKDNYYSYISTKQIESILSIKDKDYEDEKNASTSLLRYCLLRTAFTFISDDRLKKIYLYFNNLIEEPGYLNQYKEDSISKKFIIASFQNYKKDKERPIQIIL